MDRLIFTSNATINQMGNARQVLVNELANTSTTGFKSSYDVALKSVKADGKSTSFDTRIQAQSISRDIIRLDPGSIMATGRPLDIAMTDKTVLMVQTANGERAFTRRGDLRVSPQGQLETGNGHLVMGQGGPITVPAGVSLSINSDGSVFAQDTAQPGNVPPVLIDQMALRDASDIQLLRRQDGLFQVADKPVGSDFTSGPNLPALIPKALEGSNVSAIEAMARLMDHSRSFETQIRIIKETKGLDESGSSMMKLG